MDLKTFIPDYSDRAKLANTYHAAGYNCVQAVAELGRSFDYVLRCAVLFDKYVPSHLECVKLAVLGVELCQLVCSKGQLNILV